MTDFLARFIKRKAAEQAKIEGALAVFREFYDAVEAGYALSTTVGVPLDKWQAHDERMRQAERACQLLIEEADGA